MTVTFNTDSLTVEPNTITVPGWSKPEIDITDHGNADVTTAIIGTLKDYGQIVLNLPFETSEHSQIFTGNQQVTITFTGTGSTTDANITFYANIQQVGDLELASNNSEKPTYDLTVTVTNWDGSTEVKPSFTAAS
jgi:hypothetical protein